MKKILLFASCALSAISLNAQICLAPPSTYGTNSQAYGMCMGDFNHDGFKDLATCNIASLDISVILGDGTGKFGAANNIPINNKAFSICAADFNNDGNLDFATADRDSDYVSILLGNGLGGFGTPTTFTLNPGSAPYSVCSADFNNDGKMDLATAILEPTI